MMHQDSRHMASRLRWAGSALLLLGAVFSAAAASPDERFRESTALLRAGDIPAGVDILRELAATGHESVNLYWNWAQGATARGHTGEALWALLRAREVGPHDTAVEREIERLRTALRLEVTEINPVPTAGLARAARDWHLGALSAGLAGLSVLLRLIAWRRYTLRWPTVGSGVAAGFALALVAVVVVGATSRPTAVVTARDAALWDSASATARPIANLREGEVVTVHDSADSFLRIQDSSGARGWARTSEVWVLDRPPDALPF